VGVSVINILVLTSNGDIRMVSYLYNPNKKQNKYLPILSWLVWVLLGSGSLIIFVYLPTVIDNILIYCPFSPEIRYLILRVNVICTEIEVNIFLSRKSNESDMPLFVSNFFILTVLFGFCGGIGVKYFFLKIRYLFSKKQVR
jgi:hypothetical protein